MSESDTPPGSPPPSEPPSDPPSPPPPPSGGAGAGTGAPPPPPAGGGPGGGDAGGAAGGTPSPNRGLMIVLAYLGPLALIPLLVEKEDREVQWHAKHGLVLFGAELAICIVIAVFLTFVSFFDAGCTACVFWVFSWVPFLAVAIVHILCIVKGVNGERFLIPGISPYADKF